MTLLPSEVDYKKLTKNFTHHVARILKEYMPFFSSFGSGLETHIRHQYYEEMSQKSEVVSFANINNIIIVLHYMVYLCYFVHKDIHLLYTCT